ncbi:MAG TPA: ABC transporter permease [Ferruginibacter sp.]|nr:ABC transporter permease [Ferruginibacter sp.]HPH91365.1 ABC transporter permease [Ferruginibacter sp.]
MQQYSQSKATWAITRASLKSMFRSPQSVFFSIFFPIVLIVIFGALSGGGAFSVDVAFDKSSDTANIVYQSLKNSPLIFEEKGSQDSLVQKMKKGQVTALLLVKKISQPGEKDRFDVHVTSSSASQQQLPSLLSVINGELAKLDKDILEKSSIANVTTEQVEGRAYKLIDFYLPGMIGFSLIGSAVFGVAFLFFNLRETLVLKRLYASPVKRLNIIFAETFARVIFQIVTVVILILFGKFLYGFTLANGFITFLEMIVVCLLALIVFMGAGFIISSVAKNQNVIPIYSNLFMFPQYFLSGTFFPKGALPKSFQWLVEILPLTALNDALRKISFEGAGLLAASKQIGILAIWGVLVYLIAARVFKWE